MALRVSLPANVSPDDDWCIPVYIPADPEYLIALRSVLTLLTKWYHWERDTDKRGKHAAQRWAQADLKTVQSIIAGHRCGDCGDTTSAPTAPTDVCLSCGGIVILSEDDMGQVVTEVKLDKDTGELLVYYGKCCVERIPIGAIAETAFDVGGESIDTTFPPVIWPEGLGDGGAEFVLSDCAMATTLVDRIFAVGEAAFNARTTPYTMAAAIREANPGYSFRMMWVTSLWVEAQCVAIIEGFDDLDLFNSELKQAWKCFLRNVLRADTGDQKALSQQEWVTFMAYPYGYPFYSEWPDAGVLMDEAVANWWNGVCNLFGRERANQIMWESLGQTVDCIDCETDQADYDPQTEDWYVELDFRLNAYDWDVSPDGGSYQPGLGWQGGANDGSYLSIVNNQLTPGAESKVKYLRVEYSLTPGDGTSTGFMRATQDSPDYELPYSEFVANAGNGVLERYDPAGIWFFPEAASNITWRIELDTNNNGDVRSYVTKIIMAGDGVAPLLQVPS